MSSLKGKTISMLLVLLLSIGCSSNSGDTALEGQETGEKEEQPIGEFLDELDF